MSGLRGSRAVEQPTHHAPGLSGVSDLDGMPQLMSGLTRRIASQELYEAGSLRAAGSATSQIMAAATARAMLMIANGLRSRASSCRTCLAADTLLRISALARRPWCPVRGWRLHTELQPFALPPEMLSQQHTAELLEASGWVFRDRGENGVALETLKAKAPPQ